MNTMRLVKNIQDRFQINAIYARIVFDVAKSDDFEKISKIIEEKPKPFVKWVGGKRQLLKQFLLLNLYPPNDFDPKNNTYFEPFVGGGAVFFDLLPKKAVLSDLNKELIVTYNVIKNNVEELIKNLKKYKHSKEYFLKIRKQNIEDLNDLEIASRFIYLNHTCFNGLYRVNSKGEFNVPFGKYKNPLICDEVNLRRVSKSLKNIKIKHQDFKEVLKSAEKGDFIYFDPPYYPINKTSSFTSYTKEGFLEKEQTELRDLVIKLHKRGCYIMLSNSDTPFINKIYSGIKGIYINKVKAKRSVNSKSSGRGKIYEVLITNYKNYEKR